MRLESRLEFRDEELLAKLIPNLQVSNCEVEWGTSGKWHSMGRSSPIHQSLYSADASLSDNALLVKIVEAVLSKRVVS